MVRVTESQESQRAFPFCPKPPQCQAHIPILSSPHPSPDCMLPPPLEEARLTGTGRMRSEFPAS